MDKLLSPQPFIYGIASLLLAFQGLFGEQRPNVLLICVDDLRAEVGSYGFENVHTPNIDRLASRGMQFNRHFVQVPQCGPSRLNLLTGMRPDTIGVHSLDDRFRRSDHPNVSTLGEYFKRHGYHTQAVGKVFHSGRDDPQSWSVPTWENDGRNFWFVYVDEKELSAMKIATDRDILPNQVPTMKTRKFTVVQAPDVDDRVLSDGIVADQAIATLRGMSDEPFLLAVGFYRPHLPFIAPKKYFDLYPLESITLPERMDPPDAAPVWAWFNASRYFSERWRERFPAKAAKLFKDGPPVTPTDRQQAVQWASGELRSYSSLLEGGDDRVPPFGPIDIEFLKEVRQGYLAATSYVDAQIGRVLGELKQLGLTEKTIVILWSDHGFHLGEHGIWGKLTNYELDTLSPLIIFSPNHPPSKSNALVETVDIFPTLVELAGLPLLGQLEGTSMVPLLEEPDRPWKSAVFSQYPRGNEVMGRAVRTDRYRYVEWQNLDGEVTARELYDHKHDSGETINVADRMAFADTVRDLGNMLQAGWMEARP